MFRSHRNTDIHMDSVKHLLLFQLKGRWEVGYKRNLLFISDGYFAEDPNGWKKILPDTRQWHILKIKNIKSSGSYIHTQNLLFLS